jgi:SAM-dependent methyltransferase
LEKAAKWRGNPVASSKREFSRLIDFLNPSKEKDIFYDLGCGYGRPCIWIAPEVKLSIGIESHYYRYLYAKRAAEKSGLENIRILWNDIDRASYRTATLLYSVIYVGFEIMSKINRQTRTGTKVVLYGVPPYPLRSKKLFANYHLFTTPFEKVEDDDEFARVYTGRKSSTMKELIKSLDRDQARDLKNEMKEAEKNWEMF